jgi:hypothetical protein
VETAADIGSGAMQGGEKALLAEVIAKVNDLLDGEPTSGGPHVYP